MEQRKDLKIQPVQVASTDPAFISGLMSSGDEPEEPGGDAAGTGQTDVTGAADAEASAEHASRAAADAEASAPDSEEAAEGAEAVDGTAADAEPEPEAEAEAGEEAEAAADGPVFEASDRRGSVAINAEGVRFTLDDQAAEWTWDEIGAVEYETSRFGRRLTVTVHTPDRRWYPGEVQAGSKAALKEWTARLDDVLDAYFDDEDEAPSGAATDAEEAEEADAGATAAEAGSDDGTEAAAEEPGALEKPEPTTKD